MKTSRYTEARIIAILRQAKSGVPVAELCREHGVSEAMAKGLFPRPIKLGEKSSAWPVSECNAVLATRIRGASEDQIRALAVELTAARMHRI